MKDGAGSDEGCRGYGLVTNPFILTLQQPV
jgi:hypothetical protein